MGSTALAWIGRHYLIAGLVSMLIVGSTMTILKAPTWPAPFAGFLVGWLTQRIRERSIPLTPDGPTTQPG